MARGENTADHPGRRVARPEPEYEIGRGTATGSERVGYHLTGGGYEPPGPTSHGAQRFGTHSEALGYVEKHGLKLKTPKSGLPPSDAGDVGWAGR